ncbi:MAG TPA: hypothetical protein VIL01_14720 [Thermomicrobiales bacterium]
MSKKPNPKTNEKPSDKYAQSDEAPPPGRKSTPEYISNVDAEDIVQDASEDSFPASDPPSYTRGRKEEREKPKSS